MQPATGKIKGEVTVSFSAAQTGDVLPLAIGAEIGRGSTSVVCAGRAGTRGGGGTVAVKVLRPSLAATPAAERFRREATLLCRLTHPNIVRGLGTGSIPGDGGSPDVPFAVLERIDGTPLDELLRRGEPFDSRRALELVGGISSALGYLHLDGRVQAHRDIKPANIIVCPGDVPKLIDLGVAKTHLVEGRALETRLAGTVRYMSPEQLADSSRVDIRSDIYALGIVLLEMLGCTREWGRDNRAALASRFDRAPPRLSDADARRLGLAGSHRAAIDQLLAGMCAYEPHERFQTPRDLTRALQDVLAVLERAPARGPTRTPRLARPGRRGLIVAIACAAGALCIGVGLAGHAPAGSAPRAQPPAGHEIVIGDGLEDVPPAHSGSSPLNGGM